MSYVSVHKMYSRYRFSDPQNEAKRPAIPVPPAAESFPGLDHLDRPELDEDMDPFLAEPDTVRCPVPDWTEESGVTLQVPALKTERTG